MWRTTKSEAPQYHREHLKPNHDITPSSKPPSGQTDLQSITIKANPCYFWNVRDAGRLETEIVATHTRGVIYQDARNIIEIFSTTVPYRRRAYNTAMLENFRSHTFETSWPKVITWSQTRRAKEFIQLSFQLLGGIVHTKRRDATAGKRTKEEY
jgi:hypothetical protein